ncbi:hypothetical protein [Burkholderia vietnamiensis]|uniref:hypothetical protein n=1 Tax=Burkholderia vietnamiensis TaxID=60552 RepID=UPI00075EEA8E|nr:hypothetical protein [Burkholderia vietnamiensis]KVR92523.1 hypothetical protein WK27_00035 [Burkholderia vietnamiensis]
MTALVPLASAAGVQETVLAFNGSTFDYAGVKPDGGLQVQHAWEGYQIVKRSDGTCYRIAHSNLRIERVGNGQRAMVDETIAPQSCALQ